MIRQIELRLHFEFVRLNHFTGKERDGESGLDYFGARYYVSSMVRMMSPDEPFGDRDPSDPQKLELDGRCQVAIRNAGCFSSNTERNTGVSPLRRAMKPHGFGRDDVRLAVTEILKML